MEKKAVRQTTPVRQPAADAARVATRTHKAPARKGRVRGKPPDETLEAAVRAMVKKSPGSCCAETARVYRELARHVDTKKELGTLLLTWARNAGCGAVEIGKHTAATATWSEGTFVIDTTAGQFGGPDVFIGSVAAWRDMILGLQRGKVSHVECEDLAGPIGDTALVMHAAAGAREVEQDCKPRPPAHSHPDHKEVSREP